MHLGPLCMQLRAPDSFFSLWEGQKWGFFPKDRTYRAFIHQKKTFIVYKSAICKNGVFSLRIAHIAPSLCFCTKGIFFG